MTGEEVFEGFDESRMEEHREEARARWGKEAVDESYSRVARYTKEDWAAIQAESKAIVEGMASLMDRDPADPEVQKWIERHHRQINECYYSCSLGSIGVWETCMWRTAASQPTTMG